MLFLEIVVVGACSSREWFTAQCGPRVNECGQAWGNKDVVPGVVHTVAAEGDIHAGSTRSPSAGV